MLHSHIMPTRLETIYSRLFAAFGPQHWWPGDTPFEIIVGAILTQNTAWTNVEKAIANLKSARLLSPSRLHAAPTEQVAALIRPSGYYNLKAVKLKAFVNFLFDVHHGRLAHLWANDIAELRDELLSVHGIGPETADSIILYAAGKPIFVIDAYTRRITARLGLATDAATYDDLQHLFMDNLPPDATLFNEYHALLVRLAKQYCRKTTPACGLCPLRDLCSFPSKKSEQKVSNFRAGF